MFILELFSSENYIHFIEKNVSKAIFDILKFKNGKIARKTGYNIMFSPKIMLKLCAKYL